MIDDLFSLAAARAERDKALGDAGAAAGIAVSHDHAERVEPGWSDKALLALQDYVQQHTGEEFIAPIVRKWAEANGLQKPATNYAWGSVFQKAARRNIIQVSGYGKYGDKTMNTQSVQVWTAYAPHVEGQRHY